MRLSQAAYGADPGVMKLDICIAGEEDEEAVKLS
jgi:hypothetical protein